MKMFQVQTREAAFERLNAAFSDWTARSEWVGLDAAPGATLAQDIVAAENLPSFRRSTVDGYAVRACDTVGASDASPGILQLVGQIEMGKPPHLTLNAGQTAFVPTGGAIPDGADAMIMMENTEKLGHEIVIQDTAAEVDHILGIGDDVPVGKVIFNKGTQVKDAHVGLLASLGITQVKVASPLKVAILSTGDELVQPGQPLLPGQVRDSNRTNLTAFVRRLGGEVVYSDHIRDDAENLKKAMETALEQADIVLLSGGSSVGGMDFTEEVMSTLGEPGILVHGLAIKPGKPTLIAKLKGKAVFGLPGHPAACTTVFMAIVAPFMAKLIGRTEPLFREVPCTADFQLHAAGGREVYQMVKLIRSKDELKAQAIFGKSGCVSLFAEADGYIVIPMSSEGIRVGDRYWVTCLP